jgi:[ribosomal protein S5]-alanine N-acetyltransferase
MPTRTAAALVAGPRVYLRPPRKSDQPAFLAAVARSRSLHRGWVIAPKTPYGFRRFVKRFASRKARPTHLGFLVFHKEDDGLVGVFNFSEIVRSAFKCAYLGYYAFTPQTGAGLMTEGIALALDVAFRKLRLHRIEVNVQPHNRRSLALAKRVGFTREGYSRRYVKIAGRWRDHVRLAILAEDWRGKRAAVFARLKQRR